MSDTSKADEPRQDTGQAPSEKKATQQENAHNPDGNQPPTSANALNPQPAPSNCCHATKQEKYSLAWWKDWFELAAILGGFFVGILIWFQYKEMVRATNAARRATEVSQEQLEEMRQQRLIDARAWVSADVKIDRIINEHAQFIVTFKNTGRTPAVNVQQIFISQVNWTVIPKRDNPPNPRRNAGMISPDGSFFSDLKMPITALRSVEAAYVYGTVWYDDIFGNHHWTQFCQKVSWDEANATIIGEPAIMHNSCDDMVANQSNQNTTN